MEKAPCISVIVPVYQVERFLRKCLDSLLSQTFKDFEVILVDDGSTDNSGSICDEYAQKDERFRVFHQKNGGVSKARNKGLKEAIGEYLIFVDSDDWVQEDFLFLLRPYLGKFDVIFFGLDMVIPDGHSIKTLEPPFKVAMNSKFELADMLYILFRMDLLGYVIATVIRRNIIVTHSLQFEEAYSLHEDFLFLLDCYRYASTFVSLSQVPYKYVCYKYGDRLTLSNTIPVNYKEILQLRQRKVAELLSYTEMKEKERRFIEGRLMCNYCRASLDIALSQNRYSIQAVKDCVSEFAHKEFVADSLKDSILFFLVKKKMPYIIFILKKLLSVVK